MHLKAKQRIESNKGKSDNRPIFKLPVGPAYKNFKDGVDKLCDSLLENKELTIDQKNKIAKLKAHIKIEM